VADLGADGQFDLVVGNMSKTILWYRHSGRAGAPVFASARLIFTDDGEPTSGLTQTSRKSNCRRT